MKKKLLMVFVIFLVLVLAGIFIGKPILETYITKKAESSLTESYGAEVNIKSIKLDFFKQKVFIKQLEMTNPYKPLNNALYIPLTELTFDIKKWFTHETIYLEQGQLTEVEFDRLRLSKKKGQVDRKKYPKNKQASFDFKDINLKKLKNDFRENIKEEIKKTKVYKELKKEEEYYKSLSTGEYKEKTKSLEEKFKALKAFKLRKDNFKEGITLVKGIQKDLKSLKGLQGELKRLQENLTNLPEKLGKTQSALAMRFLDENGFGSLNAALQEKLSSLFHKKKTNKKEITKPKKTVKKGQKREDILFYVKNLFIKGRAGKFDGFIKDFHNKDGEDSSLWQGEAKLLGEVMVETRADLFALNKGEGWDIKGEIKGLSLSNLEPVEEVKILDGLLNIKIEGGLKEVTRLKGVIDIKLNELTSKLFDKNKKWGHLVKSVITRDPFKMAFWGQGEGEDINWDYKWLSKLPNLVHPLKNEAKEALQAVAKEELNKLKIKTLKLNSLSQYQKQLDELKGKVKKNMIPNLINGLLKKL